MGIRLFGREGERHGRIEPITAAGRLDGRQRFRGQETRLARATAFQMRAVLAIVP